MWKNNFLKVIDRWRLKGLTWKNNLLDKVLNEPVPEPKLEIDLRPWDHNLIETLNLFNRAKDCSGQRLSKRRLLGMNIKLDSIEICNAIKLGLTDKIRNFRNLLSGLMDEI